MPWVASSLSPTTSRPVRDNTWPVEAVYIWASRAASLANGFQPGGCCGGTLSWEGAARQGFRPLACPNPARGAWGLSSRCTLIQSHNQSHNRDTASNPTGTGSVLETETRDQHMPERRWLVGTPGRAQRRRNLPSYALGHTIDSRHTLPRHCGVVARAAMVPLESGCGPRDKGGSPRWAFVVYRPNSSSVP